MSWIEIIADRKIRDAQEDGAFDNLPGKGKPLQLDFDPRVPPEQRAAYRLMKEAQILPDWIQLEKELRQVEEAWSRRLQAFAHRRGLEIESGGPSLSRMLEDRLDRERDRALLRAAEGLVDQNGKIDRLNLIVPTPTRHRRRIDLRARMAELEARYPRFHACRAGAPAPWAPLLEEHKPEVRATNRMPIRRKRGSIG